MQDHFADGRLLPPIDESQDWFLISGEERIMVSLFLNFPEIWQHDIVIQEILTSRYGYMCYRLIQYMEMEESGLPMCLYGVQESDNPST